MQQNDFAQFAIDCSMDNGLYEAFRNHLQTPGLTPEKIQSWFQNTGVQGFESYSVSLESCSTILKNPGEFKNVESVEY